MLTPEKHDAIYQAIKCEMSKHQIQFDETILNVARPILKTTWEDVEQQMTGTKRKGK